LNKLFYSLVRTIISNRRLWNFDSLYVCSEYEAQRSIHNNRCGQEVRECLRLHTALGVRIREPVATQRRAPLRGEMNQFTKSLRPCVVAFDHLVITARFLHSRSDSRVNSTSPFNVEYQWILVLSLMGHFRAGIYRDRDRKFANGSTHTAIASQAAWSCRR